MTTKLLPLLIAISYVTLTAADKSKDLDPFDTSVNEKKVTDLGVPTWPQVKVQEEAADKLYASGDWKAAAVAEHDLARSANWLSNIISAGLRPYYNADSDEQSAILRSAESSRLISYEKTTNELRRMRDHASVKEADCYFHLGDKNRGVVILLGALDTLTGTDSEYWGKARRMLYAAVDLP